MKTLILTLIFIKLQLFAFSNDVKRIFAIGIFDTSKKGENLQNTRETKRDYNGVCYTKIYLYGRITKMKPKVKIGNSIGHYENSQAVYNKEKIKIGQIITYKHYNVTDGILKVYLGKKLYDSRIYVK